MSEPGADDEPKTKGSSPNAGEGRPDLEEEVLVLAEAVGHALDSAAFMPRKNR
jgi:hypothetical protein